MFGKSLALLLVVVHLVSCSGAANAVPTISATMASTNERTASTKQTVTPISSRSPGFTSAAGNKLTSTVTATANMTPHTCPDPWFEATDTSTSPLFLLAFSALYAAFRFDLPPDRVLFELPTEPAESFAASFSQDQHLIAYYLPKGKSSTAELWVSDVTFCDPILFYTDDDGQIAESNSYAYFQWGPGDKTVIFRSDESEFPMLIYNLETLEAEFWQGVCEDILYLDETDEAVVGCSHDGEYSYLHQDGRVTTASSTPKSTDGPVVAWSFSREGDAAYITSTNEVYLLLRNGEKIKLPLEGFTSMSLWDPDPLQWAAGEHRLLVLAYDPQEKRCPADRACWFVIEGKSGEVVWWLKPGIIEDGAQWNEIDTVHPAAISIDGEHLALQYFHASLKFLLIIHLSTNEILTKADVFSDRMAWPGR